MSPRGQACKYGDPLCSCQDGDMCHYEGENPMTPAAKKLTINDITKLPVDHAKNKAIADQFREELKKAAHQHMKDPVIEIPIPATTKPEALTGAQAAGYWARFLASQFGRAMRMRWILATWPIAKRWGVLKCMLSFHDWEDAANVLPDGTPDTATPGTFKRCKRPACRIYRDTPQLKVVRDPRNGQPVWFEVSDQFEVIARAGCRLCQGRGYSKRMLLPAPAGFRVTAQVPCECLRVQPRFVKREKVKR